MEPPQSFQQDGSYKENSIHVQLDPDAQLDPEEDVDVMEDELVQELESQAAGFVGKASELQWLRRLQLKAGHTGEASGEHQSPYSGSSANAEISLQNTQGWERHQQHGSSNRTNTNVSSFYLDNDDLRPDLSVQAFDLPSHQTAERLLNSYLTTIQATFPMLAESPFKNQFEQLYASPPRPSGTTNKWLALLNLVFAIGRRHLDLTEEDASLDNADHGVYWSRAHVLGLEGFHAVGHADITQVQSTGLLALYLLTVGHVNRAWVVMGSSLRLAHALGLHVRNESRTSTVVRKEIWLRMWWGVYSLERHLSTIVGRPNFVNESYCSAPLPLPLSTDQLSDEALVQTLHQRHRTPAFHPNEPHKDIEVAERPNEGSYLKSMIQLSITTQKVMTELYSIAAVIKPWRHIQQVVTNLCDELEEWLAALPADLNFSLHVDHVSTKLERERLILNMQYISTKILITRPCVCRFGSHEQGESENFDKQTARACVWAAKKLVLLLPAHSHVSYLCKIGPWWSVVHSLMQALIVLLLEMSYGTVHFPEDGEEILVSIKKLIRSLKAMGKNNKVAERAYTVAFQVLRGLASKLDAEISDLIWEDIAHSTAPSLDVRVPNVDSSQQYPIQTMEDEHVSGM
ncbi:hypothetical protein DM02DRAFT_544015 [Periconia macrospinosa]|uniref:Xylanolytic transcriptional activator regulatory domain-containing protein n=1 Tax=Periconia macrospinosa TaxID=97972 RepID=A0A2V1D2Q5_9PLEO|nr:hypothetical protein DM02DRAFT_544015 [Periconia macrospinosa]